MLDVPIYGRIATLELFRPHVSIWLSYGFFFFVYPLRKLLDTSKLIFVKCVNDLFCGFTDRLNHKIFSSSRQKDINSVSFSGILKQLRLLQGLRILQKLNFLVGVVLVITLDLQYFFIRFHFPLRLIVKTPINFIKGYFFKHRLVFQIS